MNISYSAKRHRSSRILIAACAAAFLATAGRQAAAETINVSESGGAVQALWTTCPATITREEICTFTALFATRGTNVSPVAAITMAYLRVYPAGYAELLAYASGFRRASSVFTINTSSLSTGRVLATLTVGEACYDPFKLWTCAYTYPASLNATFTGSGGTTTWSQSGELSAPSGLRYTASNGGGARSARLSSTSARFNNAIWPLGRSLGGLSRYSNQQRLTCPGACPTTAPGGAPGAGMGAPALPGAPQADQAAPPPKVSMQDFLSPEGLSSNIEKSTGLTLNRAVPPASTSSNDSTSGRMADFATADD